MDSLEIIEGDPQLMDYLKRPAVITKRSMRNLLYYLSEDILLLRAKLKTAQSRMEKNVLYMQIENRKVQSAWAADQLEIAKP